ncbi:hypothetical protein V1281_001910 [Nitrobacteraceae bacterium AZCC 2161]
MRKPSFRDALAGYSVPKSSTMREHLERWGSHHDAEGVWKKISAHSAALDPQEFIRRVLLYRNHAAGFSAARPIERADKSKFLKWYKQKIVEAMKSSRSFSEIAETLEEAASALRLLEESFESFRYMISKDADSRKDQDGSLARSAFCLTLSEFFIENCNIWLDEQVATLCDIAFPGDEPLPIESVKAFRNRSKRRARAVN